MRWSDLCLRATKLYIDTDGGAANTAKNRGTLAHYVFERMNRTLVDQGAGAFLEDDEIVLLDHAQRDMAGTIAGRIASVTAAIVDEVADEHPELTVSVADKDKCRIMAYHYAVAVRLDPNKVIAIEQQFALDVEGYTLVGTVDLAQMAGHVGQVVDMKSGLYVPTQEAYHDSFQPAMYSALLLFGEPVEWVLCGRCQGRGWVRVQGYREEHAQAKCSECAGTGRIEKRGTCLGHGINLIRSREVYPRLLLGGSQLHFRERTRTRAEVADFVNDLQGRVRQLKQAAATSEWPATRNAFCHWCPAPERCPIPRDVEKGPILDEVDAVLTAERWDVAGQSRTNGNEALRKWVEAHGPLRFGKGLELVLEADSRGAMRLKRRAATGDEVEDG
jgi:hypothetical protein